MANTKASLETAFKYVQEKKLLDLKPNSSIVYDMAPMKEADFLGRKHLTPVVLSYELGFTFGDGDAFQYEDDVAGIYEEIEVDPNPVVLKSRLSVEAADRMAHSDKAVISHVTLRTGQMKSSLLKMAEIDMLHGRTGVGTIKADPVVSTNATIIFTDATWAPGIWSGMEKVKLEARNGSSKVNSNADLVLVSVDFDNKSIVVSGDGTDLAALDADHVIYFKGAYANGQYGIKYQLSHSGSIFGIDNTAYALFKAQQQAVAGSPTMSIVLKGVAKATSRAGLDSNGTLLVPSLGFEKLNSDLAALSVRDSKYSPESGENGYRGIKYHGQGGTINIVAHPMMMEGDMFFIPDGAMKRVGSTDISFRTLDGSDSVWQKLEAVHAYQLVARYSFQVLIQQPAKCVYFSGVTLS